MARHLARRVHRQFSFLRVLVFIWDGGAPSGPAAANGLEFKRVLPSDEREIDEITERDPWNVPKSVTLEKLRDQWFCFVAKADDHVVACGWAMVNRSFLDDLMNRQFILGPGEAYYWRGFSVPECRGRGITPQLLQFIAGFLYGHHGVTRHIIAIRATNSSMRRAAGKVGWHRAGCVGFLDVCGVRFHYLFGREAFSHTKQRIFMRVNRRH